MQSPIPSLLAHGEKLERHSRRLAPAPSKRQPDTLRTIYYALGANLAITLVKFCGAVYTGSGALMAEGFHSLADSANEGFLLLGRKQAKAGPTAHHPLGHGRATYFWSFVVTLLLFTVGGLFSVYEGVHKLQQPEPIESPWLAVTIVVFAMIAEGISLRMTLEQIAKVRRNLTLWRWFKDTRRGELIVVLGEDVAAIAGLALALAALVVSIATGNSAFDAIGSMAIGALLMIVAIGLAIEIKSLLIGESAPPRTLRSLRAFLEAHPDIAEVDELITMQHGEDLIVMIRARMRGSSTAAELTKSIGECKVALRVAFPQARWIFIEPTIPHRLRQRKARTGRAKDRVHS